MNVKLDNLKKHKYDPNCKFCINNVFVKDAIKTKMDIMSEIIILNEILVEKDKYGFNLSKNKKYVELYEEMLNKEESNKLNKNKIDKINSSISLLDKDLIINHEKIKKIDENIKKINENIIKKNHNKDIYLKISKNEEKIHILKNYAKEEYEEYQTLNNKYEEINKSLQEKNIIMMKNKNESIKLSHEIGILKKKIKKYETIKKDIEKNKELKIKLTKYKLLLDENNLEMNNLLKKESCSNKICILRNDIKLHKTKSKKLKKLEAKRFSLHNYIKTISKDGLPYDLLENIIPSIENIANNILLPITNFTINIKLDSNNINIYKIFDKYKNIISLCSGFEQFMIGLSIRIALTQINNLSWCSFIAIDEGLSCMDSDNINNLTPLLNYLKEKFDFILLMSHIQTIKGECDNILTINKKDGFSNVKFI